jgi:hypothetical protein
MASKEETLRQLALWNYGASILHLLFFVAILIIFLYLKFGKKTTPFVIRVRDRKLKIPPAPPSCAEKAICSLDDCASNAGAKFCSSLFQFQNASSDKEKLQLIDLSKPKQVAKIYFIGLIISFPLITALFHLLNARVASNRPVGVKLPNFFEHSVNPLRWAEYSITATIMIIAVAGLCGVVDSQLLWGIAALMIGLNIFGIPIEDELARGAGRSDAKIMLYFIVSTFMFVTVFNPIVATFNQYVSLASTKEKGNALARFYRSFFCKTCVRDTDGCKCKDGVCETKKNICRTDQDVGKVPSFVKVVIWGILILYAVFPVIILLRWYQLYRGSEAFEAFATSEKRFVLASFVAKAFLIIVVATGLLREDEVAYLQE